MKISVFGAGYVGLVTAACFAEVGHHVVCCDKDATKVDSLRAGKVPFFEPGLSELVASGVKGGRLEFTSDVAVAIARARVAVLAVGTPPNDDGSTDLRQIHTAAQEIRGHVRRPLTVLVKSTVPVGTNASLTAEFSGQPVNVISNPEFLREGNAVADFLNPSRVVVGGDDPTAVERVAELYEETRAPVILCDATSAETIKYAANAFLATKISFINSIANICEHLGADVRVVADAIGRDPRIGGQFLQPGPGFGGSCFPKDTIGLVRLAEDAGYDFGVLKSVIEANEQQLDRTVAKVRASVGGSLSGANVAVWGLTFKANTDDRRHSPAVAVVSRLLRERAVVTAYDPTVTGSLSDLPGVQAAPSAVDACREASVLVVLTEWREFAGVEPDLVRRVMAGSTVVDARNVLDPVRWQKAGFVYRGTGF